MVGVHYRLAHDRATRKPQPRAHVATSCFGGDVVVPDTGTLAGDLERWLGDVATDLTDPGTLALMRATIGSGPEGGCACIGDRHEQLSAIIERERSRGGRAPEVESAVDFLLGPLYHRAIFSAQPASSDWARELVATFLAASEALA